MRSVTSLICLIGAIASTCVFLGRGFQVSVTDDGTTNRLTSTNYMGFPLSPWWEYKKVVVNEDVIESSFNVHFLSASWLFLVLALLLFAVWHKAVSPSMARGPKDKA